MAACYVVQKPEYALQQYKDFERCASHPCYVHEHTFTLKTMPKINKDELCSFICHLCLSYYCTTQFCCYHIHFLAHLCCTSFKSHCFSVILPATLSFVQSISS